MVTIPTKLIKYACVVAGKYSKAYKKAARTIVKFKSPMPSKHNHNLRQTLNNFTCFAAIKINNMIVLAAIICNQTNEK